MVGSSELSKLLRMKPQETFILEQRSRANCLNKNMRKMHKNFLSWPARSGLICIDIAWSKEALERFVLVLQVFRVQRFGEEHSKYPVSVIQEM